MNKAVLVLLALVAFTLSACVAPPPAPSPASPAVPQPSTVTPKGGKLRISLPSLTDLEDITARMALDTLKQQGYTVTTTEFARFDLETTALANGEIDIANSSHQTAWAAIAKGAPIERIVSRGSSEYVIAAKAEIKTCADLHGKSIAYSATANTIAAISNGYLKRNCPTAQPQITVIPSSSNRMAALLSGVIDSAFLDEEDALELERHAPGKFHILRYFSEEFPLVEQGAYYAHKDFAAKHPEVVKDFIIALLQANRRVQDPQVLREAIARYLPDDAAARESAERYLAHKAWDVNGGATPERIQYTLNFLTDAKMVPAGLDMNQLADFSYLNAVLAEIGRR